MNGVGLKIARYANTTLAQYTNSQRRSYIMHAVASVVATRLELPPQPVVSINVYYGEQHETRVADLVGRINEEYVLDTNMVLALVKNYYTVRYNMVYKPETLFAAITNTAMLVPGALPLDAVESLKELAEIGNEPLHQIKMFVQEAL